VSIATYWEIGIKSSIGRLDLNADLKTIFKIIEDSGFATMPITPNHILENARLTFHHQDPFDRIIIAQAIMERMIIITKDSQIELYDGSTLWLK